MEHGKGRTDLQKLVAAAELDSFSVIFV